MGKGGLERSGFRVAATKNHFLGGGGGSSEGVGQRSRVLQYSLLGGVL